MICLLAGNFAEAVTYAAGQNLNSSEWFYPADVSDLLKREAFHVLVIGTAGENVPNSYFNRIYEIAQMRGRVNRL